MEVVKDEKNCPGCGHFLHASGQCGCPDELRAGSRCQCLVETVVEPPLTREQLEQVMGPLLSALKSLTEAMVRIEPTMRRLAGELERAVEAGREARG